MTQGHVGSLLKFLLSVMFRKEKAEIDFSVSPMGSVSQSERIAPDSIAIKCFTLFFKFRNCN